MIFIGIFGVILLIVIIIFALPKFSPIPYFPSNGKDIPIILKALDLKNGQVVFDMGAGDGIIIFEAARKSLKNKLTTQFIAVEMNPILILILHIRRLMHPNKKNVRIIWADMFKVDYSRFVFKDNSVTVYVYVSPRFISKIIDHMRRHFHHFQFVSYYYPIEKKMKPYKQGVHAVYKKTY